MRRAFTHLDAAPTSGPHNDYDRKDNTISYHLQIFPRNNTNPYPSELLSAGLPHPPDKARRTELIRHGNKKIRQFNIFYPSR